MINHVRTLLINDRVVGDPVYVPESFSRVDLDGTSVGGIEKALFPSNVFSGIDRVFTVSSVLRLLHRPELDPYTRTFDPRITYTPGQVQSDAVSSFLIDTDYREYARLAPFVRRVARSQAIQSVAPTLFQWPESDAFTEDLNSLRQAWTSGQDTLLSIGALTLAFVYQVERIRISK